MPGLIARGGTITLEALTTDNFGQATDASPITVSIIDSTGTTVLSNATPTHVATGVYTYAYAVGVSAPLGAWAAEWTGTIAGFPLVTDDGFTVVTPPTIVTPGGGALSVDSLITQVEDHLLSGDRDEINTVSNTVDSSQTTVTFNQPLGSITAGSYLGVELEVMYVWSIDTTSGTATVQRAMLGTTAAGHASGTIVYVNPLFSKWEIFKALNVEIVSLSAADNGLFAEKAFTLTTQPIQKTYDIPVANADLRDILEIRYQPPGPEKYWPRIRRRSFQVIRDVTQTVDAAPTGMMLRIEESFYPGRPMVVRYAGDFGPLPAAMSADAATATGMAATMLDIPALGAAGRLMGVRSAKRTFVERAVDSRRSQEVPASASAQSAGILLQLMRDRIKSEADRLRQLWPSMS